jgi:hypothetical protein
VGNYLVILQRELMGYRLGVGERDFVHADTREAFFPLNSAMTARKRCSPCARTWYEGVVIAVARPSENIYNPISENT